ncbi:NAD(P)H:quinone oxidoreductase [Allobranchiibius huperziae]|uniref:NAD(P)H dehydrogenase (Quinone) n=1 Tax=Allobranchiibius huperziae TaxID=1874116 RepID=A0A853DLJ8_9MICO|nr:NAD(P)H:quinone oxidoreductase [Allobranchiibius huperziae]NYJ75601.1 NAD(P)H dehydrogenase (quinone) [Allobranchiibius huperziae]
MTVRVAVVYYSATGSVHRLAEGVADGARTAGADVRLRRTPELAPDTAIAANPVWQAHVDATKDSVETATLADLEWCNALALGTPTRFGTPAAQLKQFIDSTGGLWQAGGFNNKPATSFTSSSNQHGGQESTILALNNVFYHWGCIIVSPGYTDPLVSAAGGNPYGTSWPSGDGELPDAATVTAAHYQGKRLAAIAQRLQG